MLTYLDSEYKCHINNDGAMTAYEVEDFDGKCQAYIEGHRCVPDGEFWQRADGEVFTGMIAPWQDSKKLEAYQAQYEAQLAAAEAAYESGVNSI